MKRRKIVAMIGELIAEFKENGQWGTAHIYKSAANAFTKFLDGQDLNFTKLTPSLINDYESFLRANDCSNNTVATYIKVLKATYNRAVENGAAEFKPRLFAHAATGMRNYHKRSLDAYHVGILMRKSSFPHKICSTEVQRARLIFTLMFLMRGIPFVDLAFLRKDNICNDCVTYFRRKTGRPITVRLTKEAQHIMQVLSSKTPTQSPYVLPYISSPEGSEAAYKQYQRALRRLNHLLKHIETSDGVPHLSSYTPRHTWATMAYYCEVHHGVISEAMGHSSLAITQSYLRPLQNDRIDNANTRVINFVKSESLKVR